MATIASTQQPASYTINFVVTSTFTGTPTVINIYKNAILFHTLRGTVGVVSSYTFNEVSLAGSVVYTVDGYANAAAVNPVDRDQIVSVLSFNVLEYKPTFTLPTISCVQLNQSTSFYPTGWNQNENFCPATPLAKQIKYERYEFDMNTSTYVKIASADQITTITGVTGAVTTPETYAYTWTPNKLAMVKIVTTVTNCSTSVEKATVFPVCGSWKIRRLACGDYRIYNYKLNNINYTLSKGVGANAVVIQTGIVGGFSYEALPKNKMIDDDIYTIVADTPSTTQYIINYCSIEACMLDLHKRVLLDETLCDDCKMDKVLYQKALRLLPTYETWKKLVDKDWIYDMQYKSTDAAAELAKLYDAQELYLELKNLCVDCGNSSTKPCNCN
jgi:hypothetical protein